MNIDFLPLAIGGGGIDDNTPPDLSPDPGTDEGDFRPFSLRDGTTAYLAPDGSVYDPFGNYLGDNIK